MTSGDPVSVARCRYCGKEFDVRRFQVVVIGRGKAYDSTECALLDADDQPSLRSGTGGLRLTAEPNRR
jgi:hypothetical protein